MTTPMTPISVTSNYLVRLWPTAGKSMIQRAARTAQTARPLDAAENDSRGQESEYSHSDGAHW